jgi:hypothetical protein
VVQGATDWLTRFRLRFAPASILGPAFPPADPAIARTLDALWRKYAEELVALTAALADKLRAMHAAGLPAVFNDFEGELLYILVRETRPELVYEISPNSGFSTNYLVAAVTKNGVGRVEGYELIEAFNGVPTPEVIKGNLVALCDADRYHVNIGDARVLTLQRLAYERPNLTLLDSNHDDFFGEFYINALLPRLAGTVVIQDVAHFDPRPEWSTEAYYLLSHFQLTGTEFLLAASYEDELNRAGARAGLAPRRPYYCNSVVITLGDEPVVPGSTPDELVGVIAGSGAGAERYPLNVAQVRGEQTARLRQDGIAGRYLRAYHGRRVHETSPALCDLLAVHLDRAAWTERMARSLTDMFSGLDPCSQVLAVSALSRPAPWRELSRLIRSIDLSRLQGADLLLRLATAAGRIGESEVARAATRKACDVACQGTVTTASRHLLDAAAILRNMGDVAEAKQAWNSAVALVRQRDPAGREKYGRELVAFALTNPVFLPGLAAADIGAYLPGGAALAAKSAWIALKAAVRRAILRHWGGGIRLVRARRS